MNTSELTSREAPAWQTSSYSSGTGDLDATCVQVAAVLR